MLKAEAAWLGAQIRTLGADCTPLLNVGSSSAYFRTQVQPWIDALVLSAARERGIAVVHQDLAASAGVDVVGDLLDPACQASVRGLGVRSILCTSVLEHVSDRVGFARLLEDLLPPGGRLLLTVPHAFPYHPDPIDTMFRPTPEELSALFPGSRVVDRALIPCGRLHDLVLENPSRLASRLAALARGGARREGEESESRLSSLKRWLVPWSYRPFELSCVHLEKRAGSAR